MSISGSYALSILHPPLSPPLARTMGLLAATSIGVGTMVGAGIFVFPGITGAQAGPAALLSFLLSGLIALVVAACTAELATAMPNSGGGYFFVSRSFGPFWGTLVGIAQWIGLVFACAFYLVGFGEYSLELIRETNIGQSVNPAVFAIPAAVLLLLLNVVGTRKVGKFQNLLVLSLTALLVLIFSYGLIDVLSVGGNKKVFSNFFPEGKRTVLITSALIFTSYLGFVQISTIAGEIKEPSKNLPRALIGSVLIVIVLYLLVLFVTTSLLPVSELERMGETATLEVAQFLEEQDMSSINFEIEVVQTKSIEESISRAIEKHKCNAILSAQPIPNLRRILVPLYDPKQLTERVRKLLKELKASSGVPIQLVLLPGKAQQAPDAEAWEKAIRQKLGEADVKVNTAFYKNGETAPQTPEEIMKETANDSDLVLLPESDPSDRDSFFSNVHQKIEAAVSGPVMVILKQDKN